MKTNQDYKNSALAALKGKWTPAVICTLVYLVVSAVASTVGNSENSYLLLISVLLSIWVTMPLGVGVYCAFKNLYLDGDVRVVENMFNIGFTDWKRNVIGMFLASLFTFLWMLLLIVPGVIKGLAYSFTPFILKEHPELSPRDAIRLSVSMMEGHKWDFFLLCLSFFGWILLSILTLGIGLLWLVPYMYTTYVAFYEDVRAEYECRQITAA